MAQPEYVPGESPTRATRGELTPGELLPGHPGWKATRPGDHESGERPPSGAAFGAPGPDQGYGMLLAEGFVPRLHLAAGERADDVVAGCLGVALRRASMFHRAPVAPDLELAFGVWGFLTPSPPADLVEFRSGLFESAADHYTERREIVGHVPVATLRMKPGEVLAQVGTDWRSLITVDHAISEA